MAQERTNIKILGFTFFKTIDKTITFNSKICLDKIQNYKSSKRQDYDGTTKHTFL